jgi:hypothetical protein
VVVGLTAIVSISHQLGAPTRSKLLKHQLEPPLLEHNLGAEATMHAQCQHACTVPAAQLTWQRFNFALQGWSSFSTHRHSSVWGLYQQSVDDLWQAVSACSAVVIAAKWCGVSFFFPSQQLH